MNLVLAILKYPRVLRCAQEEIDRVVGTDRLPSFKDREQLPYMNALCTELLRYVILIYAHLVAELVQMAGYRAIRFVASARQCVKATLKSMISQLFHVARRRRMNTEDIGFLKEQLCFQMFG